MKWLWSLIILLYGRFVFNPFQILFMFHTHPCSTKHVENIPFSVKKKLGKIGQVGIRTGALARLSLADTELNY